MAFLWAVVSFRSDVKVPVWKQPYGEPFLKIELLYVFSSP